MERSIEPRPAQARDRVLLTAAEVAKLLHVPQSWVREQTRRGRIPTVTLGRYRRYRREAIEAWIEELEAGNGPTAARSAGGGFTGGRRLPEHAGSSAGRHARARSGR
jgi:excisionase family DNA binding protein